MQKLRLLSLWQPWASGVVTPHPQYPNRGIKEFETRHWNTPVRGRILIHAAKKWDKDNKFIFANNPGMAKYHDVLFKNSPNNILPRGGILGVVNLIKVITSENFHKDGMALSQTPTDEFYWGNWEPGRFGFRFSYPILFAEPILFRATQQPFMEVPIDVIPEQYHSLFK